MKPRVEVISEGIVREAIAEHTHLQYDPATKSATVTFQYRPNLYIGDAWNGAAGDFGTITKTVDELALKLFGAGLIDPVTGADLGEISGAGLVLLIKAAFTQEYDASTGAVPPTVDDGVVG